MIRIYIIEDHEQFIVGGIKRMFSSPSRDGITVVGSSPSVEDCIGTLDERSFDILILDLWLQNRLPLQNFRLLKNRFPDKPIIMLTAEQSYMWQRRMFKEGAHAYIKKTAGRDEFKTAIEMAMHGEKFFPSDLKQVEKNKDNLSKKKFGKFLTPEIEEILTLLSQGYNHKAIADHLGVSESKIDKVLKELREKFGVNNSLELVLQLKNLNKKDSQSE